MTTNPFPGLRPFEADENHLFFGRDVQSDEILARLRLNRFVAVVGTSGSGKSSLIRAGVLPSLHGGFMVDAGSRWRIAVFRPGNSPLHNMAVELNRPGVLIEETIDSETGTLMVETTLRRSALGLIEAVRQARMPAGENLLVVVDQFEELFRFKSGRDADASEEEAVAFVKLLIEATRQEEVPVYIVITMRSDFLGECAHFRDLPNVINQGLYLIPLMTRAQHREAIMGPVAVAGSTISTPLVNRVLNEIGDSPEQLPIMQHALMRTWGYWSENHTDGESLDLRHYGEMGGMAKALSKHADEAYDELTDERQLVAEKVFRTLAEKRPGSLHVRRPTKVAEICAITEASEVDVIAIVESFRSPGRSFLMPPPEVSLNSESLIDISHESLIGGWEKLRGWVEGEALSAAIYRRIADTAVLFRKKEAELWRDLDVQLAFAWRNKAHPNKAWAQHCYPEIEYESAIKFLEDSKNAGERRERSTLWRTRVTAGVLGVLFLAATTFAVRAYRLEGKANALAAIATREQKNAVLQKMEALIAKESAVWQTEVAVKARDDAETAKEEADKLRNEAYIARDQQERERLRAVAESTRANKASRKAEAATIAAEQQKVFAQQLSIRIVKENLTASNKLYEITELLENTDPSPQQRMYLHQVRAIALSQIQNHAGAIEEITEELKGAPTSQFALGRRGYAYLVSRNGEKALLDIDEFLKNESKDFNQYLNKSIAFGMLGRYQEAYIAAKNADDNFTHVGDEWQDLDVSKDIQVETLQEILYADGTAYKVALKYQLANLLALSGGKGRDFAAALKVADDEVRRHPRPIDSYLVALNWAWLGHKKVPEEGRDGLFAPDNYCGLVIQGALWERIEAGQQRPANRAKQYYQKFLEEHRSRPDPRYNDLATWVQEEIRWLNKRQFPVQQTDGRALSLSLYAERELSLARTSEKYAGASDKVKGSIDKAIALLDQAVKIEPENVDLRIKLINARLEKRELDDTTRKVVIDECDQILAIEPNTRYARGVKEILEETDRIKFLRKFLTLSPGSTEQVEELVSNLSEAGHWDEAFTYIERAISMSNKDRPQFLYRKAKLLAERGREEDLADAQSAIDKAIELKPDTPAFYDEQEKIMRAVAGAKSKLPLANQEGDAPRNEREDAGTGSSTKLIRQRSAGYNTAAELILKRDKSKFDEAIDIYAESLKLLAGIPENEVDANTRWDMAVTMHTIGTLLVKNSSQAVAIDDLKEMFGDLKSLESVLNDEIIRLKSSRGK